MTVFYPIDASSLHHFVFGVIIAMVFVTRKNFLLLVFLPILLEVVQLCLPGRIFDLTDVFATYLGSSIIVVTRFCIRKVIDMNYIQKKRVKLILLSVCVLIVWICLLFHMTA